MYFRDVRAMSVIVFIVAAGMYTFIMGFSYEDKSGGTYTAKVSLMMSVTTILVIIPYFTYLTLFIDPDQVLQQIAKDGIDAAIYYNIDRKVSTFEKLWYLFDIFRSPAVVLKREEKHFNKNQEEVIESIEKLSHFALHALDKYNKGMCLTTLSYVHNYDHKYMCTSL